MEQKVTQSPMKKIALITGASRGIGRGIALCLAKHGYDVAGIATNPDPANSDSGLYEVKARVEALGQRLCPIRGDVANLDDHPRILDAEILDPATGKLRNNFSPGDNAAIRVHVRNNTKREKFTVAIGAKRTDGTLCFAHTTQFAGLTLDFAEGHVTLLLDTLRLLSGEFGVSIWLFDETGVHIYQERPAKQNLVVSNRTKDLGLFLQDHRWVVEPGK